LGIRYISIGIFKVPFIIRRFRVASFRVATHGQQCILQQLTSIILFLLIIINHLNVSVVERVPRCSRHMLLPGRRSLQKKNHLCRHLCRFPGPAPSTRVTQPRLREAEMPEKSEGQLNVRLDALFHMFLPSCARLPDSDFVKNCRAGRQRQTPTLSRGWTRGRSRMSISYRKCSGSRSSTSPSFEVAAKNRCRSLTLLHFRTGTTIVTYIPGNLLGTDAFSGIMDDISLAWVLGCRIVVCVGALAGSFRHRRSLSCSLYPCFPPSVCADV